MIERENCIVEIARRNGRSCVSPEDVRLCFIENPEDPHLVHIDALEILAGEASMGPSNSKDVALAAWNTFNR